MPSWGQLATAVSGLSGYGVGLISAAIDGWRRILSRQRLWVGPMLSTGIAGVALMTAGAPRALAAYQGLRRDRTARVQLGSRRQGTGYDSSASQLIDRRWIYEYDAWAEAVALT